MAAVCSLWHCPAGHPGWVLPTALPYGARTFLDARPRRRLRRRTPRSPGQLLRTTRIDETPGRPSPREVVGPAPSVGKQTQLRLSAVSSMTNDVWSEESSVPENETVTVWPAKDDTLKERSV